MASKKAPKNVTAQVESTPLARRVERANRIRLACLELPGGSWPTKAGAWRIATEILLGVPMLAERAEWWEALAKKYVGEGKRICEVTAECILETYADENVLAIAKD